MSDSAGGWNSPPEKPPTVLSRFSTTLKTRAIATLKTGGVSLRRSVSDVGPGLFVILGLEILVFWLVAWPNFLTTSNFITIGKRMAITGISAVGETIVIIAGGFDLSVGSVAALASVGSAAVVDNGGTVAASILTALAIGSLVGLVNGAITGYGRINPLITTLGTLAIVRGIAFVVTNNKQITVSKSAEHAADFLDLGKTNIIGMPWSVLILLIAFLAFGFMIPRYRFGRYMYAIGSNERAAALAGVRVNRWKLVFYGVCGMLAGVTGFVNTFQLASGIPSSSLGLELAVITAVILGGTSLYGGRGRLLGTFLGVMFLSSLLNGLILSHVEPTYQRIASGSALILAVLFDEWRRRRFARG